MVILITVYTITTLSDFKPIFSTIYEAIKIIFFAPFLLYVNFADLPLLAKNAKFHAQLLQIFYEGQTNHLLFQPY